MKIIKLTPLMGYPVYYDTLTLFSLELDDGELIDSSTIRERRIAISSLGTTSFLISSFHRPISKVYPHVYKRRPKASTSL